jgi:hypothetical protein
MYWKGIRTQLQDDNIVVMSTNGEVWANVPLYLDEVNHSPTGFEWGYNGSGPSQLAYAILRTYFELVDVCDSGAAKRFAKRCYVKFKNNFVAKWGEEWNISHHEIDTWVGGEKAGWVGDEMDGWV